jgi:hypothetical protein
MEMRTGGKGVEEREFILEQLDYSATLTASITVQNACLDLGCR